MNTDLNQDELRALMAKATSGPYIAVDADGTPCVGRVNADSSGGKGFLVAEGWSLSDCEYVAAALNALPDLLNKLDELAAALRAEQAVGEEQRARELLAEEYPGDQCAFMRTLICDPLIEQRGVVETAIALRAIRRALGTARQSEFGTVPPPNPAAMVKAAYAAEAMRTARQSEGVVFGVTKVERDFRWDGDKQHHVPLLTVEFDPVLPTDGYDAKGWKDRDALATLLAAAPGGEGEG